jgi:hypothetical protein
METYRSGTAWAILSAPDRAPLPSGVNEFGVLGLGRPADPDDPSERGSAERADRVCHCPQPNKEVVPRAQARPAWSQTTVRALLMREGMGMSQPAGMTGGGKTMGGSSCGCELKHGWGLGRDDQ